MDDRNEAPIFSRILNAKALGAIFRSDFLDIR